MADRSRRSDTTDDGTTPAADDADGSDETTAPTPDRPDDDLLSPEVVDDLRAVADRLDEVADSLPYAAARHHARAAARAAREAADPDGRLVTRRAAVGELVTELRTAADEAEATRDQYRLLETLYEAALPATRAAGSELY